MIDLYDCLYDWIIKVLPNEQVFKAEQDIVQKGAYVSIRIKTSGVEGHISSSMIDADNIRYENLIFSEVEFFAMRENAFDRLKSLRFSVETFDIREFLDAKGVGFIMAGEVMNIANIRTTFWQERARLVMTFSTVETIELPVVSVEKLIVNNKNYEKG